MCYKFVAMFTADTADASPVNLQGVPEYVISRS